jgi:hypothetical protein
MTVRFALPSPPLMENARVEPELPDCHSQDMATTPPNIPEPDAPKSAEPEPAPPKPREIGGPKGPEPTRYGDWEVNGRCTDF